MADSVDSAVVSSKKYLDLAFEYSKLKDKFKQLGVLGQRIIGEKESAVADAVQVDRKLRQTTQENENLKFRNNQLTVRISVLQEELKGLRQKCGGATQRDARASGLSITIDNPVPLSSTAAMSHTRSSSTIFGDYADQPNNIDEGINTFVEVTKNQVANMANENEELVRTIQTMRNDFDAELNEKFTQINLLQARIDEFEKQLPNTSTTNKNNLVSSFYRKISMTNNFFNRKQSLRNSTSGQKMAQDSSNGITVVENDSAHSGCQLFHTQHVGLNFHMVPSRISRKKIKSNERVIVSCLESFVGVINNMCTDIAETIRNSPQSTTHSGLQYYDFSTSLSLIQLALSSMREYESLAAFNQNRFVLIHAVIDNCCTALTMIEQLLQFHFNHLNTVDSSDTTAVATSSQSRPLYRIHLLQVLQKYLSILATTFKNLYTPYALPEFTVNDRSKAIVFTEIQNTLKLFMVDLNSILCSVVIENNMNNNDQIVQDDHRNINTSNQQLYLTLNSLLKTRSTRLIDVINMFMLVTESEKEMLENYGWFSSHMISLDPHRSWNENDDSVKCGGVFQKITHSMNSTNNQLKTAHLTTIGQFLPSMNFSLDKHKGHDASVVKIDQNNTHCVKSLKEKYLQLQQQLIATIKKLDDVTNTNELLQFKLKTSSTVDQSPPSFGGPIFAANSNAHVVADQIQPSTLMLDELKNYVQERICAYQSEHRKILSHICVLLSDWQAMKYRLEECQKSLKGTTNEATRYKNEHASLSAHLMSMKESYEKNVVELTEKLSLSMISQASSSTKSKK